MHTAQRELGPASDALLCWTQGESSGGSTVTCGCNVKAMEHEEREQGPTHTSVYLVCRSRLSSALETDTWMAGTQPDTDTEEAGNFDKKLVTWIQKKKWQIRRPPQWNHQWKHAHPHTPLHTRHKGTRMEHGCIAGDSCCTACIGCTILQHVSRDRGKKKTNQSNAPHSPPLSLHAKPSL